MATQKKSPVAQMREQHKDKETLVDRLLGAIESGEGSKDDLKTKLLAASNKKLLRLLAVANEIKDKYGSSQKLAETLAKTVGKAKDQAYIQKITKLAQSSPARVLDMVKAAAARTKAA
ncbi:MAG: hypothetical protein EXR72_16565 [Myxococcales bacterium]|nr:hypothetical protein [Myxococcales bacterium]